MSEPGAVTPTRDETPPPEETKRGGLRGLLRGLGLLREEESSVRQTFEELIERHEDRGMPIQQGELALLEKILTVGGLTAYDVMVPRADIVAVEHKASADDVVKLMAEQSHSRLPVYRGTLDDVIGMIHIKDVLGAIARKEAVDLQKLLRKTLFVAPSMRVLDLLLQMRVSRIHMALVVDEYGGIDGLITIEDLVEQIVGEIEDEHDTPEGPLIETAGEDTLLARARATIAEFEGLVGPVLTEEEREQDIDTLGGLVFTLAGRVPVRGELIVHPASGIEFEVVDADPRRVRRLRVRNLPSRQPSDV